MKLHISQHRDLSLLTAEEWQSLDVHLFIWANMERYIPLTIERIGRAKLPEDIYDILPGIFCDIAFRPLVAVHQKHLDAHGQKRNQVMLGTLKMISITRMVEAVIREFPINLSLEEFLDSEAFYHAHSDESSRDPLRNHAAVDDALVCEADPISVIEHLTVDDAHVSDMLEWIRAFLPTTQYRHMRWMMCEGKDFDDIARLHNTTVTNIRVSMLNGRKRLLEMMPPPVNQKFRHLQYRRSSS